MRDFQKKKSKKPNRGDSDNVLEDIDGIELDGASTDILLNEIDSLLNECSKPIEKIEKKKEAEKKAQEKSKSSGSCSCF
ncbi:MAG: hypothetical protein WCP92_04240 [bacterium]